MNNETFESRDRLSTRKSGDTFSSMLGRKNRTILHDLLTLPTAPFAEHHVIAYIETFVKQRPACSLSRDAAGNLLVRFKQDEDRGRRDENARNGALRRPICITAHMDHPGFVSDAMSSRNRLRAWWRGWVPPELFRGTKVRFFVDGDWTPGVVRSVKTAVKAGRKRVDTAVIEVKRPVPPGSIGMWDFADPWEKDGRIYARGCDDLAGCAALLCCIDRLNDLKTGAEAYFLFTRAEEVGFVGAIAACRLGTIPPRALIINTETSSELPGAPMGEGPILRIGDKSSLFSPSGSAWLGRVAATLQARDRKFRFQRKLMDGGTCEASAFNQLGYESGAVCVALGNYHNVDRKHRRIAPEYINLSDFENLVKWFVAMVTSDEPFDGGNPTLAAWLADLEKNYADLLARSVPAPA